MTTSTLPPAAYTELAHYHLECARIFRCEWLLVGSAERLREPGDYLSLDIVGEPIVVVRDAAGDLRALSAVCRHRYMVLVEPGRGRAEYLTCPYHLWRYKLDGRLDSAPFMADVRGFDRAACRLPIFQVEEWEGFVFVNLDPAASALASRLEPVRQVLARYRLANALEVAFYDRRWDCNWKLALENGSESYHHMGTHPESLDPVLPSRGTYICSGGPGFAMHRTPLAGGGDWGIAPHDFDTGLTEAEMAEMTVFTIFPSTIILTAGELVAWFSMLPDGVGKCRFINGFCVSPALVDAGLVDHESMQSFMDRVNGEDQRIVETVQRGVASTYAQPGMLSHKEGALVDFYTYLRRALASDRKPYEPYQVQEREVVP